MNTRDLAIYTLDGSNHGGERQPGRGMSKVWRIANARRDWGCDTATSQVCLNGCAGGWKRRPPDLPRGLYTGVLIAPVIDEVIATPICHLIR